MMVLAVVMILHVWVMYRRSRAILGTLLVFLSLEVISISIVAGISSYLNASSTWTGINKSTLH